LSRDVFTLLCVRELGRKGEREERK
jgi:hypothetical protein